ncbi:demethylmenaquinone methyltransferase / 2-methoxy-6-polyprenyl-1,4-benzoquinol methylase [Desulfacinum hydrothermale DSM 13146]|uniref:Demethylmenaquinone methyltransferase n=1 Tax=Desulfacinum hydrothermale DSM 13146 TaxID=1121390 RepID=A0A1W1XBI6_9BACT|nr:bifunctional demethylmenaquinone methyltransferase/2-methoxy-6-polyprenyl-1,4-benzoquinol methylase UbiE [Desulfacinum hydrothermale]SMC21306.1 demethylmenaquinone methyltransferase / 2-methoxy-6-polyprenyl-1,4-benzoquinol methylase [Desulfacinum hydrothermale DSM 13146]
MQPVSLEKTQQRIGSMFDRIAATYDFLNHFLSAGLDLWWRRKAVRALALPPGSVILDVATGTGDLALAALQAQGDAHVVGLDLAFNMLQIAQAKRDRKGWSASRYPLLQGDALELPFPAETFHAVMIAYGIRNVPHMGAALKEFHRVLRPGGLLLVLEFTLPSSALLKRLYLFYFEKILPRLGGAVSRDPEAYAYLPASVGAFVTPEELSARAGDAGFHSSRVQRLTGGITYFLTAVKNGGQRTR